MKNKVVVWSSHMNRPFCRFNFFFREKTTKKVTFNALRFRVSRTRALRRSLLQLNYL